MREFFTAQMDCIFFFYGLAFILMAVAAYFISRKRPAQNFWKWIALFGLIHGISEWLDMLVFSLGDSAPFKIVRIAFLTASFLCFTEVVRLDARKRWGKLFGPWVYAPLLSVTVGAGWILGGLMGVNILSRHILGLIGGLLAVRVIVTSLASQDEEGKDPVLSLFVWFLACYFTTQFFASKGTFLPASMINQDVFFSFLGFPVQLLRMVLALVLASIAWTGYLLELLQRVPKEEKVKRFRKDLWFPASLMILLLAGWIMVEVAGQDKKAEEREDLAKIVEIAASMIDPDGIKTLSGTPADFQNEYYKRIRGQFLNIVKNERDVSCAYLVGQQNGKTVFLFDLDQKSVLGEGVYEGNIKLLNRMFSSGGAATVGPGMNKWGAFVSSLVAINDPADGKVIAVLGFDHDVKVWNTHIARYRLKYIFILFLFTILYIVFFVMFKREREIRQSAQTMGESLKNERIFTENAVNAIGDIFYAFDLKGKFLRWNETLKRISGYSDAELRSMSPTDFFEGKDIQRISKAVEKIFTEGRALQEADFVLKDRRKIPYEFTGFLLKDGFGNTIGFSGTGRDITERRQAEAYREMGEEVLRILQEVGDFQDALRRVLVALKARTGFDAVGMRLRDGDDFPYFGQEGFPKDFILKENTLIERGADGGICRDSDGHISLECTCGLVISGKIDLSHPLFTKEGSFWTNDSFPLLELPSAQDSRRNPRNECIHQGYASVALVPLRVEDRIIGLLQFNDRIKGRFTLQTVEFLEGIATHIAMTLMRRKAEEAVRKSEERFRAIFEGAPLGVAVIDSFNGNIYEANKCFADIVGRTREELTVLNWMSITHPDDVQGDLDNMALMNAGKTRGFHMEKRYLHTNGSYVWINMTIAPLIDKDKSRPRHLCMVENITERKRIEEEKTRLLTIIEESKDFIGVADPQGNLLYHNTAAKKMVGLPEDADLSHMKIRDMHPVWAAKIIEEKGIPAILKEGSWMNETVLLHQNGSEIPVSQLLLLHRDPLSGKPAFISTIMRDITEYKRLTEALKKSRESLESQVNERTAELVRSFQKLQTVDEELKRASKAKSEFLANMSHELRTPLNSIIGFSEVLHDERFGPLNERQKRYAENVMASGRHLLALINEVLDLSKVEAGKMTLEAFSFPIRDCIEEVMRLLESQALSKKIKPVLEVPGDLGEIRGDKRKIQQVITNLLSNAIKFTQPRGKIGVRVRRIEGGIEVTVWDTGVGIAPENLEKAFRAFERLGSPYTQETEGTGLGLTISKKLVELHGGRIWIESGGEGKGTAVKFTIPSGGR